MYIIYTIYLHTPISNNKLAERMTSRNPLHFPSGFWLPEQFACCRLGFLQTCLLT